MKNTVIISILLLSILALTIISNQEKKSLNLGEILFVQFNAKENGSFAILTKVAVLPNTIIQFTDSKWNGNHFGFKESNMTWNSGRDTINAGEVVRFYNLKKSASVSHGSIKGTMNLSSRKDAIFAYSGYERMPQEFLAAAANDRSAYGTLINTQLEENKTAVTFPKDSVYLIYTMSSDSIYRLRFSKTLKNSQKYAVEYYD